MKIELEVDDFCLFVCSLLISIKQLFDEINKGNGRKGRGLLYAIWPPCTVGKNVCLSIPTMDQATNSV